MEHVYPFIKVITPVSPSIQAMYRGFPSPFMTSKGPIIQDQCMALFTQIYHEKSLIHVLQLNLQLFPGSYELDKAFFGASKFRIYVRFCFGVEVLWEGGGEKKGRKRVFFKSTLKYLIAGWWFQRFLSRFFWKLPRFTSTRNELPYRVSLLHRGSR